MKSYCVFFLMLLLVCLNSCKKGASTPPAAFYTVVNASPDLPGLDFILDGTPVTTNLPFGADSGYFTTAPGIHDMVFRNTGSTGDLINVNLSLTAGQSYDIFATNLLSQLNPVAVADNAPTPPGDSIEFRLLNFYVNSPSFNIQLAGTTDTLNYYSRTFNDQNKDTSKASFHRLIQDLYSLRFTSPTDSTFIDSIPGLLLTKGNIYTFYLKGIYGDTSSGHKLTAGVVIHQ